MNINASLHIASLNKGVVHPVLSAYLPLPHNYRRDVVITIWRIALSITSIMFSSMLTDSFRVLLT